jgi:hypothetical protein
VTRTAAKLGLLLGGLGVGLSGCADRNAGLSLRPGQSVADLALRGDIVQVKKFYPVNPWLSFDEEGDPNPEGFKVNVYLVSAASGKGAFGAGDIIVTMYSHPPSHPNAKEPPKPKLEKRWVLTPEDCLPFRAKREFVMGLGYGLRLNWGPADVLGKTVSVRVAFQRWDGKLIKSQPQTFRVPPRRYGY